jgi:GNAT superfamily N-acetyltransferase
MICAPLSEHPEFIPRLSDFCGKEWAHLYEGWSAETARHEFENQDKDGRLPVTLVALDGEDLLGTVSLIFNDLPSFEHLNPWLASLFVVPEHRGKSVASFLVREAEKVFARNGFAGAWLFTETARPLFEKLGWEFFQEASCHGHAVSILRKNLAPAVAGP